MELETSGNLIGAKVSGRTTIRFCLLPRVVDSLHFLKLLVFGLDSGELIS